MPRRSVRVLTLAATVLFAALAAGCSGSGASDPPTTAQSLQASVDVAWRQYQQAHGVPGGGLAVYLETPAGNYFASSGMAPGVDQNSRFRIASNTKTFTSSAVMLLNQQGRLNIDDVIVANIPGQAVPYVPNTAQYNIPYKANITIRQLLSHTAGVFDATNELIPSTCSAPYAGQYYLLYVLGSDPNHQFSPDEWVGVDAACQASYFAPGAGYHYSNTGYSILATIIERVSGLPYDQFVIQNLITPNALSATSVPMLATDRTIPAPFNHGYLYSNGVLTDVTEDNMSANIAEGNIISSPADLARWVRRLIKGQAGPNAASVSAMMTPTPQSGGSNYGLGLFYLSGLGYGHNGAHQGYLSLMMYDPDNDVSTIVYFNIWDEANLATDQMTAMVKTARDARAVVGY